MLLHSPPENNSACSSSEWSNEWPSCPCTHWLARIAAWQTAARQRWHSGRLCNCSNCWCSKVVGTQTWSVHLFFCLGSCGSYYPRQGFNTCQEFSAVCWTLDAWHLTLDTWHLTLTLDTWHLTLTLDTWLLTLDTWHLTRNITRIPCTLDLWTPNDALPFPVAVYISCSYHL